MSETEWAECTTCEEVKPVFMRSFPETENLPYCHDCGPHRLELDLFPQSLSSDNVPVEMIVQFGPAYSREQYQGGMRCPLCEQEPTEGEDLARVPRGSAGDIPMFLLVCGDCGKRADIFDAVEVIP